MLIYSINSTEMSTVQSPDTLKSQEALSTNCSSSADSNVINTNRLVNTSNSCDSKLKDVGETALSEGTKFSGATSLDVTADVRPSTSRDESATSGPSTSMDADTKLAIAESYKVEGNQFYKEKNYRGAIRKYHQALLYLKALTMKHPLAEMSPEFQSLDAQSSHDNSSKITALTADCYNNLAACLLNTTDVNYEKVLEYSTMAADLSEGNAKALFRRGMALYHLRRYDDAFSSLQEAQNATSSSDPRIKKYLALCKTALEAHLSRERARYKGMFDT